MTSQVCFDIFQGSSNRSSTAPSIKPKSTPVAVKAQDSLMVVNNQATLQPSRSAEKLHVEKDTTVNTVASSDAQSTLLAAQAQDSLMTINGEKPLQMAGSAEQSNTELNSDEKLYEQKDAYL